MSRTYSKIFGMALLGLLAATTPALTAQEGEAPAGARSGELFFESVDVDTPDDFESARKVHLALSTGQIGLPREDES